MPPSKWKKICICAIFGLLQAFSANVYFNESFLKVTITLTIQRNIHFSYMGILRDAHGLDLIVAIQGLVGGPNELVKLKLYFLTSIRNFY